MKVLHVDDEPDIREVARLALELDPEFDVTTAESAAAALETIDDARPEVVLLDVMMPEMDGPGLFKVLRERTDTAHVPVVFMTAAAQNHTIDDLMSLGAIGVISKPFDPMSLAEELRHIILNPAMH